MKNRKKKKILKIAIVAGIAATACAVAFEIKRIQKRKAALLEAEEENAEEATESEEMPNATGTFTETEESASEPSESEMPKAE